MEMSEGPVKLKYDVSHPFEVAAAMIVLTVVIDLMANMPTQQLHDDVLKVLEQHTEPKVVDESQA